MYIKMHLCSKSEWYQLERDFRKYPNYLIGDAVLALYLLPSIGIICLAATADTSNFRIQSERRNWITHYT